MSSQSKFLTMPQACTPNIMKCKITKKQVTWVLASAFLSPNSATQCCTKWTKLECMFPYRQKQQQNLSAKQVGLVGSMQGLQRLQVASRLVDSVV